MLCPLQGARTIPIRGLGANTFSQWGSTLQVSGFSRINAVRERQGESDDYIEKERDVPWVAALA